jgi:hypothetical protein
MHIAPKVLEVCEGKHDENMIRVSQDGSLLLQCKGYKWFSRVIQVKSEFQLLFLHIIKQFFELYFIMKQMIMCL